MNELFASEQKTKNYLETRDPSCRPALITDVYPDTNSFEVLFHELENITDRLREQRFMNEKQMKTLLNSIVLLSDTIELLDKPNCTQAELIAYSNAKKVFLSLMEMSVEAHSNLKVYEFNTRRRSYKTKTNS